MTGFQTEVVSLARELVSLDSRSFVSNLAVAERAEASLPGFDIERIESARNIEPNRPAPTRAGSQPMSGILPTVE